MNRFYSVGAALMLTTTAASAGGIDRGLTDYGVMFETGNYVELGYSNVKPDISGDYPDGSSTGDMAEDYSTASLSLKYDLNEQISLGLFLNQPYGANAAYGQGAYTGLSADWDSKGVAVILKYQVNPNVSVYGGARSVESQAEIAIPTPVGAYTALTEKDRQTSYIAGAAYERPEIALRMALTYETGITHTFATTETLGGTAFPPSTTEIKMPQSVTLDFQSGVAADTLVFGSVRWSEWSVWEVRPDGYENFTQGDRVTGIDNDVMTYRIGVGRQINDQFSVFGRVTYEDSDGGPASRLSPVHGSTAFGFGGTFTNGPMKINGGIELIRFGDATDRSGVEFADNTAIGVGVSVGYSF